MAFIKHFREVQYRVPDPLHPGHSVFSRRMDWSKANTFTHNGVEYKSDADGWFDVPPDVAEFMLRFPGWCSPEMVDEEVVAGRIRADDADALPSTREKLEGKAPAKKQSKAAVAAGKAR